MSLKSGNARRRRSPSIAFRLVLLYSMSVVVILTTVCAILYFGLVKGLDDRNRQFVESEVEVLESLLQNPDAAVFHDEIHFEHTSPEYVKHYVRLLDDRGDIQDETTGMSQHLPPTVFPDPTTADYRNANLRYFKVDGGTFVLVTAVAEPRPGQAKLLQVALDVTEIFRLRHEYLDRILVVFFLGLLFTVGIGIHLTRISLRPLREISDVVRQVTASTLTAKIRRDSWPSEIAILADAFNTMLDRLHTSFDRITTCASNMAHELRTPLTNLRGEAEIALARERTPEEYRSIIESSLEEYGRLGRLIDALMFLTRFENGEVPVNRAPLDLGAELDRLVDFLEGAAEEKGDRIELTASGSVFADRQLFHRALGHILANALTYTHDGTVTVTAVEGPLGATITVVDTGCGISREEIGSVFDLFYRVDATRKMDPHGIGLGLTTVRAIMDLHQGYVTISSEPGAGTTAVLFFPAMKDSQS